MAGLMLRTPVVSKRVLVTTVHLGAIQCSANVAECRRCSADYDATSRTQGLGLRGTKPRGAPRCAGWRAQMHKGDGRQQLEKASFCAAPALEPSTKKCCALHEWQQAQRSLMAGAPLVSLCLRAQSRVSPGCVLWLNWQSPTLRSMPWSWSSL